MAKKTKARRTKKQKLDVEFTPRIPRKRRPPRTAYSEESPSPYAFQPGQSGNPSGGRPKDENRLVSRALKFQLNNRAPDVVSKALGLPRGASWAQCLAASLIRRSVKGDMSAASLIVQTIEGTKSQVEFIDQGESIPRRVSIEFVESDGNGHPRILPTTIDGFLADDPLPQVTD